MFFVGLTISICLSTFYYSIGQGGSILLVLYSMIVRLAHRLNKSFFILNASSWFVSQVEIDPSGLWLFSTKIGQYVSHLLTFVKLHCRIQWPISNPSHTHFINISKWIILQVNLHFKLRAHLFWGKAKIVLSVHKLFSLLNDMN